MPDITPDGLSKLTEKLLREHAVDFREYKPTSLSRRVERRLDATKSPNIEEYLKYLDRRPDEYSKLIDSILINVTDFFRDPEAWDIIKKEVIPRIMADKHPGTQIRIWSAGCATGEEPYSMAIALSEVIGSRINEYDVRIYATDIDDNALAFARKGEYPSESLKQISDDILKNYFTKNSRWTINRDLRKMVIFGRHNLVTDPPISHLDMIICRNVLIYMTVDLQNRILSKFYYGLVTQGFLYMGKAESLLSASRLFNPVSEKWRIFHKEAPVDVIERIPSDQAAVSQAMETGRVEYQLTSIFNEAVLRYIGTGIIGVDNNNIVRVVNSAAESMWNIEGSTLFGKTIYEAKLPPQLEEILPRIGQVRSQRTEIRIDEMDLTPIRNRQFQVSVSISPMFDVMGNSLGIIIVTENITNQVRLRNELEMVNEQLQAANEEMETTNEELQSTNEELETTNEELQSTNEELETTNEELQSTNEELTTTNDELSIRTAELHTTTFLFDGVVQNLNTPIAILDGNNIVKVWNSAAEQFFGIKAYDAVNRNYYELQLPHNIANNRDVIRKLTDTGKVYRSDPLEYKTRTAETAKCIIEYQPLMDSSGNYKGVVAIAYKADAGSLEPAALER